MTEPSGERLTLQRLAANGDREGILEHLAGADADVRVQAATEFAQHCHIEVATELAGMIDDPEMRDIAWAKVAPAIAWNGLEDEARKVLTSIISDGIRSDAAKDVEKAFRGHQEAWATW